MYSVLVWLNNLICGGGRCGVLVRTVSPCAGCLLALSNDDIGLKVLREAPAAAQSIEYVRLQYLLAQTDTRPSSIVAIHGLGAHPDDSWCANAGTRESPRWVNWLMKESMLLAVAPDARIMRYGYQSQWFGKEMMQQSVSTVAERLLRALKRTRKVQIVLVGVRCLLSRLGCSTPPTIICSALLRRAGRA
jgi:hypothetical protein